MMRENKSSRYFICGRKIGLGMMWNVVLLILGLESKSRLLYETDGVVVHKECLEKIKD